MVTVLKIGGSVLAGSRGYQRAAAFIGRRLCEGPGERFLVVVSAECGATDDLLACARDIVAEPDGATLDLLWSTGEIRSAALLALHLHAIGVRASALNVHQAGSSKPTSARSRAMLSCARSRFGPHSPSTTSSSHRVSSRGGRRSDRLARPRRLGPDGGAPGGGPRRAPLRTRQGRSRILLSRPERPSRHRASSNTRFHARARDGGRRLRARATSRPRGRRAASPASRRPVGRW